MSEGRQFFATQLERLLGLPLQPKESLAKWYNEAHQLRQAMLQYPNIETPHEIHHFYSDADIRAKPSETKYREAQEKIVRGFINELRGKQDAS
jgi:hypothetical protein